MKSIYCKVNFFALNLSRLKNEFSHISKITLEIFCITKSMSCSSAPETNIRLKSSADCFTYSTIRARVECTLSPLMIKFGVLIFWYDIFAFRFSKFKISTNFMNNNSTFSTFENIRKPSICKLMAQITKIKRLHFTFVPFVLSWSEFVSHHFTLHWTCW